MLQRLCVIKGIPSPRPRTTETLGATHLLIDMRNLFQVNVEEARHYGVVYLYRNILGKRRQK
ncbi:MAG: hypothetical protein CM15mP62_28490 [Rhodospirillaceae bacterium]|nr:MAG: hypothetical protein CM15mP62_28490 [Rhodospirillaceae bacterium]